jgi:hypothetical protein
MGKPLGIGFRVTPSDRVADEIYDAVRGAICANWTPERFISEAREAWAYEMREQAKAADEAFARSQR